MIEYFLKRIISNIFSFQNKKREILTIVFFIPPLQQEKALNDFMTYTTFPVSTTII